MKRKKQNLPSNEFHDSGFRDSLQTLIDKSEVEFEKKLTLLSSGGLGLSVVLIDKVVPIHGASGIWFLFTGWLLLFVSLATNLTSQLVSKKHIFRTIDEYDKSDPCLYKNVNNRNKTIDNINWFCVIAFVLGVVSILIFIITNTIKNE